MRTTLLRRAGAGAVLALVVALTACSSGDGGDSVASLGNGSGRETSSDGDGGSKDPTEAFQTFAACMRDHGVDMPDPQVSGDGETEFSGPAGVTVEGGPGGSDEVRAAREACDRHLEGVVDGERGREVDPEDREKFQQQALAMAKCMRGKGFDFPDPEFGDGGSVMIGGPDSGLDPTDPRVEEAMQACSKKAGMPEPGAGRRIEGGGPASADVNREDAA